MRNINSTALLLIILILHPSPGGAQNPAGQDEAQRVNNLSKVLDTGSYREKSKAILELSWPKSEQAGKLLLKTLKDNLARKIGNKQIPWANTRDGMNMWGVYESENQLLVGALAKQYYAKAVPTLRRMLKMKPERSGISLHNLAHHINQITSQPVEYREKGKRKTFPEPTVKP